MEVEGREGARREERLESRFQARASEREREREKKREKWVALARGGVPHGVPRGGCNVGHVDHEHGGASLLHICNNKNLMCALFGPSSQSDTPI